VSRNITLHVRFEPDETFNATPTCWERRLHKMLNDIFRLNATRPNQQILLPLQLLYVYNFFPVDVC
jgi:hypothetical protein